MLYMKKLNFTVSYSADDESYIAICDQFPSLSAIETNWHAAIIEIAYLVKEIEVEDEIQQDNEMLRTLSMRAEHIGSGKETQHDETKTPLLFQGTGAEDKKSEEKEAY